MWIFKGKCSRQRDEQVQRPWGRRVTDWFVNSKEVNVAAFYSLCTSTLPTSTLLSLLQYSTYQYCHHYLRAVFNKITTLNIMGQFIFYLTFLSIWNFKSLSLFWNILFPWHLWYPHSAFLLYYGWLYTFPSSAHSLSYTRGYNLLLERAKWVHINVPSYLLSVPACACTCMHAHIHT